MPGRRQRRLELALALTVAAAISYLLGALGPDPTEVPTITPLQVEAPR